MAKFFVEPSDVRDAHIYIEDKGDLKHLNKVLRVRIGDKISISDGDMWEYETELESIDENIAVLRILDKQKFSTEPSVRVSLYQGVPKAQKMETVIQKTVEMGIDKIIPVFMERTVVVERDNFSKKLQRWQKISDEAVKQCKRGIIPKVESSKSFDDMLTDLKMSNYDLIICPYENEENTTIKDCLREFIEESANKTAPKVAIIIGPEGGFCDSEIVKLEGIGAKLVTLGKTILRTETAGIVALSMIMYELEL